MNTAMKDLILQSMNQLFDNGISTEEEIFELMKKHYDNGVFTEDELQSLGEKIYPPIEDEDGNMVSQFSLLTDEERLANEIQELADECTANITAGFYSDCLGESKLFDCEDYDQTNIVGLALTATMGLMGLTTETITYKASGELECYEFTYEQVVQLAADMKSHVTQYTEEFNTKRLALIDGVSDEEV